MPRSLPWGSRRFRRGESCAAYGTKPYPRHSLDAVRKRTRRARPQPRGGGRSLSTGTVPVVPGRPSPLRNRGSQSSRRLLLKGPSLGNERRVISLAGNVSSPAPGHRGMLPPSRREGEASGLEEVGLGPPFSPSPPADEQPEPQEAGPADQAKQNEFERAAGRKAHSCRSVRLDWRVTAVPAGLRVAEGERRRRPNGTHPDAAARRPGLHAHPVCAPAHLNGARPPRSSAVHLPIPTAQSTRGASRGPTTSSRNRCQESQGTATKLILEAAKTGEPPMSCQPSQSMLCCCPDLAVEIIR